MAPFVIRIALAAVFAVAGCFKLANRPGFGQTLTELRVPGGLVGPLALAIALCELAVAVALVPDATARWGALGALALLSGFCIAVSFALLKDRRPDCQCFGHLHSAPLGWGSVARNLGFAALAGLVFVEPGSPADLGGARAPILAGALLLATVLGLQAWFSWQLFRQNGRLIARVQDLEESIAGGNSSVMLSGLPVGTPAPSFELPDLDGRPASLESLLASGHPLVIVFSDPDCRACESLLPQLGRLQAERAGDLEIVLISRAAGSADHASLGVDPGKTLLQQRSEVAASYLAPGFPSAVIVGRDGRIASPLVIGQSEVKGLIASAGEEHSDIPIAVLAGEGEIRR